MYSVVLCIHHQIGCHKIIQDTGFFPVAGIPKRAVILIFKNLGKFLERQRMLSKACIAKTHKIKNKTKNIKLRLKMLVGLQPIYLLNVLGMSSKSSCAATLCHFKTSKFSFRKTSRWKFLDVKPTHFAVSIAAPKQ